MPNMSMSTPIRKIEGKAVINFFANNVDNDAAVESTSRTDNIFNNYQKQIMSGNLVYEKKFASLDGKTLLNGEYRLLGEYDVIGWWGGELSRADGSFKNPQFVVLTFISERNLNYLLVRGDKLRKEYPLVFNIIFDYKENGTDKQKTVCVNHETGSVTLTCGQAEYDFNEEDYEYTVTAETKEVTQVRLEILKWSESGTAAKINCFTSEYIEEFSGDKLAGFEVLEEKTSSADKLSYGISANYCKVRFLNEKYKFFEKAYYNTLRKNREIQPFIRCAGEGYRPLGTFYSDEWTVPSDSQFMTVKAYDILYSLKDITINYGTKPNDDGGIYPIRPYSGQKISEVIQRVEYLINLTRKDNGILGSDIKIINKVPEFELPYTLIEEKSAWDVLQDIAEMCCAYVYVNRQGEIVIEQDNFNNLPKPDSGVTIDMSNSFTYSLPVSSRNVVNKVEIEYYDLEPSDEKDEVEIKQKDYEIKDEKAYFTVKLKKLYEEISSITSNFYNLIIEKVSYDNVYCSIVSTEKYSDMFLPKNTTITIYSIGSSWKLEKNSYIKSNSDSIKKYGVKEFKSQAIISMTKKIAINNASNIFKKYLNGISYIVSEWTGNDMFELSSSFMGDIEEDKKRKTFECLSNELRIEGNFREKTKGIEIKD